MNESTLVVVHCYDGDKQQVIDFLPEYLHHDCPVLVLSPEDSPVQITHPSVTCRSAGKRAYTGQLTLDRQRAHLEILREFPQQHFLLHDSDSVCLSPHLPRYLYANPSLVYFNAAPTERFLTMQVEDADERAELFRLFPVVFQPPVFFSRDSLERMLAVSDAAMESLPPFAKLIDWYLRAMTQLAGLHALAMPDGICRPIWAPYEIARVYANVRLHDVRFLHSIKTREVMDVMSAARHEYAHDSRGRHLRDLW